ncbi:MAG TPA: alpha/beta fold hydrolase, partial [Polyangiales bacterium]|nr:alpha/beta fold hydrolase [Polyangiales bacterium]
QANGLLLPELSKDQEVWGYHHQGSDGDRVVLTTVEALAEHIHREWLERHGERPCVLAGHSFGALLAYHVAVLREREGLPTPGLVMIDARHPDVFAGRNLTFAAKHLRRRARLLARELEARRNVMHAQWYLARGQHVPLGLRTSYILSTYYLATLRYKPPVWRGKLHIVRSEEYTRHSPVDGWDPVALGKVIRVGVPGSHLSCVRTAEGVGRVSKVMQGIFDELG